MWKSRLRDLFPIQDTHIAIARDIDADGKKTYTTIDDYELVTVIRSDRHLYEVLGECTAVYFDVDRANDGEDSTSVLTRNIKWIEEVMLNRFGVTVSSLDMYVLSACTQRKHSFHIHVPSLLFRDSNERKLFARTLRAEKERVMSDVDPVPYNKNQLVRLPLQSKFGKANTLKPFKHDSIGYSDDLKLYTANFTQRGAFFMRETRQTLVPQGISEATPASVEFVKNLVAEMGDTTSLYSHFIDMPIPTYYFVNRGRRKCLCGNERVHQRNNFVVYQMTSGELVYRCFSEYCSSLRRTIGHAPSCASVQTTDWREFVENKSVYEDQRCRPYSLCSREVLLIVADMGCGKTYQLRQLLRREKNMRVLMVTFRIALGRYFVKYMEELNFEFYKDIRGPIIQRDKLVISVNSMHRLEHSDYDLIVLDESESVLEQFTAVDPKHKRVSWIKFEKLIRDTPRVLAMDAGMSARTFSTIHSIRNDIRLIENTFKNTQRISITCVSQRGRFYELIDRDLSNGEKIVFASTNASEVISVESAVRKIHPNARQFSIWSETDEDIKRAFSEDPDSFLSDVDLFSYSPTIQAGNSIDIVRFKRLYMHATPSGPSPEAAHQMLARVRHLENSEIILFFDAAVQLAEDMTYDEVVKCMSSPLLCYETLSGFDSSIDNIIGSLNADWHRSLVSCPLTVLTVHNVMTAVNGKNNFKQRFMKITRDKKYKCVTDTSLASCDRLAVAIRNETKDLSNKKSGEVANAENIDLDRYVAIKSELASLSMSKEEAKPAIAAARKFELHRHYNVDFGQIDEAFVKKYNKNDALSQFQRARLCFHESRSASELIQDILMKECGTAFAGDRVFRATQMPRSHGARMAMAHQLLLSMGFDSCFDAKCIPTQVFENKLLGFKKDLEEYRDAIHKCVMPTLPAGLMKEREWTPQQSLVFINAVVRRVWGCRINQNKDGYRLIKRPGTRGPAVSHLDINDTTCLFTSN